MEQGCPNFSSCYLVINPDGKIEKDKHQEYLEQYCKREKEAWSICNRYIVKSTINFCPDFVLPDSNMTADEVIDKFDSEN